MPDTAQIENLTELVTNQVDKLAETWCQRGETEHADVTWFEACEHRQIAYAESAYLILTFSRLVKCMLADEQTETEESC